ncbi:hypothetical protein FVR03_16805 [Pontibacter qinzhouensis]|uniref:Uncharacterized protein n=1 Tax=Pontibacter qinzhouensis TaxID=2603253 RepID=A0A5C8JHC3_9BACT|nr:hypothetical protein [Pontibacter qinzhouensis]TXK36802.1 hypothetical protein FVR03_16805 [Pontibacter qinzhouensis]
MATEIYMLNISVVQMITLTSKNVKFVYSSFKERYTAENSNISIFNNYSFTDITGYDQFDATCEVAGKKAIVEYKVRNNASDRYPSVMIEKKKFDFLISQYEETGAIPIYQSFYTDGYALIFDLRKCQDIQVELIPCPKYTANPAAGRTNKYVINLPIERALKKKYTMPDPKEIDQSFYKHFKVC